jgi:hypothetical protein
MNTTRSDTRKVVLAGILGAIGGGLLVAIATRALPKMMSRRMSGMMQNMMGQMRENGVNPAEMCAQMMKNFGEGRPEEAQPEVPGG